MAVGSVGGVGWRSRVDVDAVDERADDDVNAARGGAVWRGKLRREWREEVRPRLVWLLIYLARKTVLACLAFGRATARGCMATRRCFRSLAERYVSEETRERWRVRVRDAEYRNRSDFDNDAMHEDWRQLKERWRARLEWLIGPQTNEQELDVGASSKKYTATEEAAGEPEEPFRSPRPVARPPAPAAAVPTPEGKPDHSESGTDDESEVPDPETPEAEAREPWRRRPGSAGVFNRVASRPSSGARSRPLMRPWSGGRSRPADASGQPTSRPGSGARSRPGSGARSRVSDAPAAATHEGSASRPWSGGRMRIGSGRPWSAGRRGGTAADASSPTVPKTTIAAGAAVRLPPIEQPPNLPAETRAGEVPSPIPEVEERAMMTPSPIPEGVERASPIGFHGGSPDEQAILPISAISAKARLHESLDDERARLPDKLSEWGDEFEEETID